MQETSTETERTSIVPAEPISETLHLTEEEAEEIFRLAEAEIQPLLRQARIDRWTGRVQAFLCLCMILAGLIGSVYGVINYPKTTVTLFPVKQSVSMTTMLSLPIRTLAPVTLTRSASTAATGHGHQDARAATGLLTFYNGSVNTQTVSIGTVFVGNDGVKVSTDQTITVPSANLPQVGEATVSASTIVSGNQGNIAAYDINVAVSSDLRVKDVTAFTGGRDARDFHIVAPQDIQHLTATLQQTLTQAIPQSFTLAPGEALVLTHCLFTDTPDHQLGEEAATVTLHASYTCQGRAYNGQELTRQATTSFTQTRPAPHYHVIGGVQTTLVSMSPLVVTLHGTWVYTFSIEYEQDLAQHIQGDTPAQASRYLLKTCVISRASVPSTLPASMYIEFLVLEG